MQPATRLRVLYFLYYGAVGANLPYFAPYLRGVGFTGDQIGLVQSLGPVVTGPVALAWASLADRLRAPARALRLATALSAAAALALPFSRTPLAVAGVLLAQALAASAVVPLADSICIEWLKDRPGLSYAAIRVFGSLGFIALAQSLGIALALRGDRPGDLLVPLAMAACAVGYAVAARDVPSAPVAPARPRLREALDLLRDRQLLPLLGACAVHWAACAPYHLLFGVFVRDSGLPASVTGLSMTAGVGAEVLALLAFPRLARAVGTRALFALAFAGSTARWWLLSRASGAMAIVLLQLFHGLTFGVFWGASVRALSALVPAPLRATGQALYAAVVFGGGNALGYRLSGLGYDRWGGVGPLFGGAAAVEGALLAITLLTFRLGRPARLDATGH